MTSSSKKEKNIYEILIDYLLHPTKFHNLHEISTVLSQQNFNKSGEIFQKIYEQKNGINIEEKSESTEN